MYIYTLEKASETGRALNTEFLLSSTILTFSYT